MYGDLLPVAARYRFFDRMARKDDSQAGRQASAAGGHPIEWHVAAWNAMPYFRDRTRPYPEIDTRFTAPR
jgi:hypothetical protein